MNTITIEILGKVANDEAQRALHEQLRHVAPFQRKGVNDLGRVFSQMFERFMSTGLHTTQIEEPQPELSCCACC